MEKPYSPEKYGLVICRECNGIGKLPKNPKGVKVCEKCGGFGFIKNEETPVKKWEKGAAENCPIFLRYSHPNFPNSNHQKPNRIPA
jgi:DnaJ-class molecular chaperone